MSAYISQQANETVRQIKQNTEIQNDVAQIAMDGKMVDIFAKMVKKVDDAVQSAV